MADLLKIVKFNNLKKTPLCLSSSMRTIPRFGDELKVNPLGGNK